VLKRLHYTLDVIQMCVRWYVAYPLSLRHLEQMMAERKMAVAFDRAPPDHEAVAGTGESISPPQTPGRRKVAHG
jgi:hypothetical protein